MGQVQMLPEISHTIPQVHSQLQQLSLQNLANDFKGGIDNHLNNLKGLNIYSLQQIQDHVQNIHPKVESLHLQNLFHSVKPHKIFPKYSRTIEPSMETSKKKVSIDEYMKQQSRLAPRSATEDSQISDAAVENDIDQLKIKREIDLEIYNQQINQQKIDEYELAKDIEDCIWDHQAHDEPYEDCYERAKVSYELEHPRDADEYIKGVFGEEDSEEIKEIFDLNEKEEPVKPKKTKDKKDPDQIDKEVEEFLEKKKAQKWTIIYTQHQDWDIDKEEYDKILINMLQSYQEFKETLISIDDLQKLETQYVADDAEVRRATRRKPKNIKKTFHDIYKGIKDNLTEVKIKDVKLDLDQFLKYIKIVSNKEIEIIHGGDDSELKKYLKELWKTLADEIKIVEEQQFFEKNHYEEAQENKQKEE